MKGKRKTWFKLWVVYVMGFINTALMHYSIHLQAIFIIGLLIIYNSYKIYMERFEKKEHNISNWCIYWGNWIYVAKYSIFFGECWTRLYC